MKTEMQRINKPVMDKIRKAKAEGKIDNQAQWASRELDKAISKLKTKKP